MTFYKKMFLVLALLVSTFSVNSSTASIVVNYDQTASGETLVSTYYGTDVDKSPYSAYLSTGGIIPDAFRTENVEGVFYGIQFAAIPGNNGSSGLDYRVLVPNSDNPYLGNSPMTSILAATQFNTLNVSVRSIGLQSTALFTNLALYIMQVGNDNAVEYKPLNGLFASGINGFDSLSLSFTLAPDQFFILAGDAQVVGQGAVEVQLINSVPEPSTGMTVCVTLLGASVLVWRIRRESVRF